MTGPRLRRLLALIVLGAVMMRVVRVLRGHSTRAFDQTVHRPTALAPPDLDQQARPEVAPAASPPDELPFAQPFALPVDGQCPEGYPVKAKLSSGIFHLPGMSAYDRTTPDRCYPDAAAATADGLRVAKR